MTAVLFSLERTRTSSVHFQAKMRIRQSYAAFTEKMTRWDRRVHQNFI